MPSTSLRNYFRGPVLACVTSALLTGLMPGAAVAQDFPTKPVRLILPFPPGGTPDVIGRILSEKLGAAWKQPVVIESKPGASSNIGSDFVAKSAPDGYILLLMPNNVAAINPLLLSNMSFDPDKNLAPITLLGITPFLLVRGPSLPVSSVQELLKVAKQRPNGVTYASSGVGSNQHMFAEMLRSLTQIPLTHVPYKGGPASIVDVVGGVVDMQFGAVPSVQPHIRSGKLTPLAVTGNKRLKYYPQVPTMIEAGIAGFDNEGWIGLTAPAGTPAAVIDRINRDVREVMSRQDVIDALAEHGIEASTGSPSDLSKRILAERARWAEVARNAGIKPE